jgi:hypothetical protein
MVGSSPFDSSKAISRARAVRISRVCGPGVALPLQTAIRVLAQDVALRLPVLHGGLGIIVAHRLRDSHDAARVLPEGVEVRQSRRVLILRDAARVGVAALFAVRQADGATGPADDALPPLAVIGAPVARGGGSGGSTGLP